MGRCLPVASLLLLSILLDAFQIEALQVHSVQEKRRLKNSSSTKDDAVDANLAKQLEILNLRGSTFTAEPSKFEDLKARKTKPHRGIAPRTYGENEHMEGSTLKREVQHGGGLQYDEAGLNYEFTYRAWEELHDGSRRYGDPQPKHRQRFHHREERKNGTTKGQYQFRLPQGRIQVVSYKQVDDEYLAKVSYLPDKEDSRCLDVVGGCSLSNGDIDLGSLEGDFIFDTNRPMLQDVSLVRSHVSSYSTQAPEYSNGERRLPTKKENLIPSYVPVLDVSSNDHGPTDVHSSFALHNSFNTNDGLTYGINNQVVVGDTYGRGTPRFNEELEPVGAIIRVKEQETGKSKKRGSTFKDGIHFRLEDTNAYFDPVISEEEVKLNPHPITSKGHADYFIPSDKIVNSFSAINISHQSNNDHIISHHSFEYEQAENPLKQPGFTTPKSFQDQIYDEEGIIYDDFYDYEHILPTTYKPHCVPCSVERTRVTTIDVVTNEPHFEIDSSHVTPKPQNYAKIEASILRESKQQPLSDRDDNFKLQHYLQLHIPFTEENIHEDLHIKNYKARPVSDNFHPSVKADVQHVPMPHTQDNHKNTIFEHFRTTPFPVTTISPKILDAISIVPKRLNARINLSPQSTAYKPSNDRIEINEKATFENNSNINNHSLKTTGLPFEIQQNHPDILLYDTVPKRFLNSESTRNRDALQNTRFSKSSVQKFTPLRTESGFVPSIDFPSTKTKKVFGHEPKMPESSLSGEDLNFTSSETSSINLSKSRLTESKLKDSILTIKPFENCDYHTTRPLRQCPPVGRPNYRNSIIKYPDDSGTLYLVSGQKQTRDPSFLANEESDSSRLYLRATTKKYELFPSTTARTTADKIHVNNFSNFHYINHPSHLGIIETAPYSLFHPPFAGLLPLEKYLVQPSYPYPPYRIPRFLPVFHPFYGDTTVSHRSLSGH